MAADWYLKAFEKLTEQAASDADSSNVIVEAIASISHHKPAKLNRSAPEHDESEAVAA